MKAIAPITINQVTPEWIQLRRDIITRDGLAIRPAASVQGFTIELKSLQTNEWGTLTLPGGALAFTTPADRDAVLTQLQGGK